MKKIREFIVVPYSTVVCLNHFLDEDSGQGVKKAGARLKAGVVPSVFLRSTAPAPRRNMPQDGRDEPPLKCPKEPKSDAAKLRLAMKRCETLAEELAEVKAAAEDIEVECFSKMFSLARFEDNDDDLQYHT